jgi:uncharacterized protein (TIGR02270 family)
MGRMPFVSPPSAPLVSSIAGDCVLWDVVDEHLAEAAFGLEQFEWALDHPSRTLSELDRYPEGRLLAHIDALVVHGAPVRERLLVPELENADGDDPARVTAAALALIAQGSYDQLWPGISHDHSAVRDATVRAASLDGGPELDRWASARLASTSSATALAALLELHATRGHEPPALRKRLRSDDPALLTAALRASRWADAREYRTAVDSFLEHPEPAVSEAALVSALCLGSSRAWPVCQRTALDTEAPHPVAMAICAALGSRAHHGRLAERVAIETDRAAALFALAFSGDVRQVPLLIAHLRDENVLHAKLALQAIAAITGLDVRDDAFALPEVAPEQTRAADQGADASDDAEAHAALPPLDEDDLDADLTPQPEDALPLPNAEMPFRFLTLMRSSTSGSSMRHGSTRAIDISPGRCSARRYSCDSSNRRLSAGVTSSPCRYAFAAPQLLR